MPLVLAGPILRRMMPTRLTFWLATSKPVKISLTLHPEAEEQQAVEQSVMAGARHQLRGGERLYFQLIDLLLPKSLPEGQWIGYDLQLIPEGQTHSYGWCDWAPKLVYPGRLMPGFVLQPQVRRLLHGSCRKPHYPSGDGLVRADHWLEQQAVEEWPAVLIMSGDQIYADDVATPMLVAIHALLGKLGLANEIFEGAGLDDSHQLHSERAHYSSRQQLLPTCSGEGGIAEVLFSGVRKPIFTSDHAQNHLMSLGEVLAMYLLVWSPAGWQDLSLAAPDSLAPDVLVGYQQELEVIEKFVGGLWQVQRLMAHLPCAMMFDDHDVTDDWNLTAGWEQTAYGQPFSKRIIGNTLLGYLICQGWGNAPEQISGALLERVQQVLDQPGSPDHESLLDTLLRFPHWHYQWQTEPILIVLDTRTHRWRSERGLNKPSGLMDWEALTDLQQQLMGQEAVIMVSPAPVFGVKLIETIQRVFTWCGKPLMVDAENWMAHKGSAYALMNLFRHPKTPGVFVILSGDVHYSFTYGIELRGYEHGADIWQITSSGFKNEFPKRLLDVLDRLNRWLYAPRSPLNWFTKRRDLRIIPHKPVTASPGERLLNAAGIGLVELRADGSPAKVMQLCSDGRDIPFEIHEDGARWG